MKLIPASSLSHVDYRSGIVCLMFFSIKWHPGISGCDISDHNNSKRSLLSWVVVIQKEGRAHMAVPALLLVWHRLFRFSFSFVKNFDLFYFYFFWKKKLISSSFFKKKLIFLSCISSQCHTNRRMGTATRAHSPFGMTLTQASRDLFLHDVVHFNHWSGLALGNYTTTGLYSSHRFNWPWNWKNCQRIICNWISRTGLAIDRFILFKYDCVSSRLG